MSGPCAITAAGAFISNYRNGAEMYGVAIKHLVKVSEEDIAESLGGTRYVMAEWIEWDGDGYNPLALDVMHQRRYRDGIEGNVTNGRMGGDYHWKHEGGNADIMAYRVVKRKL